MWWYFDFNPGFREINSCWKHLCQFKALFAPCLLPLFIRKHLMQIWDCSYIVIQRVVREMVGDFLEFIKPTIMNYSLTNNKLTITIAWFNSSDLNGDLMIQSLRFLSSVVHWLIRIWWYQLRIPAYEIQISIQIASRTLIWMWPMQQPNRRKKIQTRSK